jgi:hypothetical protein
MHTTEFPHSVALSPIDAGALIASNIMGCQKSKVKMMNTDHMLAPKLSKVYLGLAQSYPADKQSCSLAKIASEHQRCARAD